MYENVQTGEMGDLVGLVTCKKISLFNLFGKKRYPCLPMFKRVLLPQLKHMKGQHQSLEKVQPEGLKQFS